MWFNWIFHMTGLIGACFQSRVKSRVLLSRWHKHWLTSSSTWLPASRSTQVGEPKIWNLTGFHDCFWIISDLGRFIWLSIETPQRRQSPRDTGFEEDNDCMASKPRQIWRTKSSSNVQANSPSTSRSSSNQHRNAGLSSHRMSFRGVTPERPAWRTAHNILSGEALWVS